MDHWAYRIEDVAVRCKSAACNSGLQIGWRWYVKSDAARTARTISTSQLRGADGAERSEERRVGKEC